MTHSFILKRDTKPLPTKQQKALEAIAKAFPKHILYIQRPRKWESKLHKLR